MRKLIKEISEKNDKKIGEEAIRRIVSQINLEIEKKIASASRKADFAGRKTIKEEDL